MTISKALFDIVNVAGGLNLDRRVWNQVLENDTKVGEKPHISTQPQTLSDAAEQLRRLARYTTPMGAPARLLANALAIVEREELLAQRKSRNIATSGLSAGGIG